MSTKYWVVKLADNTLHTIGHSKRPKQAEYLEVVEAPIDQITGEPERGEWLQLEDLEVSPGEFERIATVNQMLKNTILAQEAADKLAHEGSEEDKKTLYKADKKKLKALKKNNLQSADDIKAAIIILRDMMLKIEEALLNVDENK